MKNSQPPSPLLSVITVTYQAEKTIEPTLKSLYSQTWNDFEHLILDGGSTDQTWRIVEAYKQPNTYWYSEPDAGLYDAMNKGIQKARGTYLMFLNAGDQLSHPQVLEQVFSQCTGQPDFIYGKTLRVDSEGRVRGWHKPFPDPETLSWRTFLNGMVICHQAMIVKRTICPLYDLRWKHVADIDWSIRTLKRAKTICCYPEVLILFLEGGYSHQKRRASLIERFRLFVHHIGFFPALLQHVKIFWEWLQQRKNSQEESSPLSSSRNRLDPKRLRGKGGFRDELLR